MRGDMKMSAAPGPSLLPRLHWHPGGKARGTARSLSQESALANTAAKPGTAGVRPARLTCVTAGNRAA